MKADIVGYAVYLEARDGPDGIGARSRVRLALVYRETRVPQVSGMALGVMSRQATVLLWHQ